MRVIIAISLLLCINFNVECDALGFNCVYSTAYYLNVGEVYSCNATLLHDEQNIEKVTSVFGTHQSGKTHADVEGLQIFSQDMEFFPVNIEAFFPNIKSLGFFSNFISSVNSTHLAPFLNLLHLDLWRNRITMLDSNLLAGLESIRFFSVQENNIKHVGHDFILPDSGLIFFNSNPCISLGATRPDQIIDLRFQLLRNCPPTISQIEDTLESRTNLLTNVNAQVQNLTNDVTGLLYTNSQLEERVAILESIIEGLKTIVESRHGVVFDAVNDNEN